MSLVKYFKIALIWCVFCIFLLSCGHAPRKSIKDTPVSTPNIPFHKGFPKEFINLSKQHKLLYDEIGKLPEIQDGISASELNSLKKFVEIYTKTHLKFDGIFIEMNEIGLPNRRKYCSPLQALFWLVEDGEVEKIHETINSYSLKKLLDSSWRLSDSYRGKFLNIPDIEIQNIFKSIKGANNVFIPEGSAVTNEKKNEFILFLYFTNKSVFSLENLKIIEKYLAENKDNLRWNNFDTALYRLNSPELINYWMTNNFVQQRTFPRKAQHPRERYESVKERICDSWSYAIFSTCCLDINGYDAKTILFYEKPTDYLSGFGCYKFSGKYYKMLRANIGAIGSMDEIGYDSLKQLTATYFPRVTSHIFTWQKAIEAINNETL
jgi:hypothetical protein